MSHLSASSIDTFLRCQQQWAFRYIEDIKSPPGIALVQGSSFHDAAEANDSHKMLTGDDLPLEAVLDFGRDQFEVRSQEVEDWDGRTPGEVVDETLGLVGAYHTELAPTVQPLATELRIDLMEPEWEIPLIGYVDVVTPQGPIDRKTSGKRKTQTDLDRNLQAAIYQLDAHRKGEPEAFAWHVAVKTKHPMTQVLVRPEADHAHTVRFVSRVQESIVLAVRSGVFLPAQPDSWGCSERFCGYWSICEFGGKT